jgi:uncharacterized protein YecT (DUF1311 family)
MKICAFILVLMVFVGQDALAVNEEKIIKQMASPTGLSEEQVREYYKSGCDSGQYVPMFTCGRFNYLYADAELNEIYQSLMKQLNTDSARTALKSAEMAWIKYRDATCKYETDSVRSGRFGSVFKIGCLVGETKERVAKLKEYLKCQDPGCPGK